MLKNKNGFTLIELLVAIFIIALISTLVTVSFLNIKRNNRDAKRINDVTEIQMALENYKFFEGSYPSELTPGEPLISSSSGNIYMAQVPENPEYQSYDCPSGSYDYFYDPDDGKYKITFCLEGKIENYSSGLKCAISEGIVGGQCIPLTVATGNPANGQADEVYSGYTFSALSGTEPYTFSVASGSSLPAGLSLSSAGSLTGTPTTYGDYDFFIEVSDAESATNSREFSMTIDPEVLVLGESAPATAYRSIAYAGHTFSASGGVAPYTFSLSSGSLPDGLSLSSAGSLTGTPTTETSYNFTIKATDSRAVEATRSFSMTVLPPPCGSYAVDYEGESYQTVQVGTQCWLKRNLNVGTIISPGLGSNNGIIEKFCYIGTASKCDIYGGLYSFQEAMNHVYPLTEGARGICPVGWHIPRNSEIATLISYSGGSWMAGKLKDCRAVSNPAGGYCNTSVYPRWENTAYSKTDNFGFSLIPAGLWLGGAWGSEGGSGAFWTSLLSAPSSAYVFRLQSNTDQIMNDLQSLSYGMSVRCIKD